MGTFWGTFWVRFGCFLDEKRVFWWKNVFLNETRYFLAGKTPLRGNIPPVAESVKPTFLKKWPKNHVLRTTTSPTQNQKTKPPSLILTFQENLNIWTIPSQKTYFSKLLTDRVFRGRSWRNVYFTGSLDGPKLGLIPSIWSFKTSFRKHFSRRSCWERLEALKPSILMSFWRKTDFSILTEIWKIAIYVYILLFLRGIPPP